MSILALLFVCSALAPDRPQPIVVDQWIRGGTVPAAHVAVEALRRGIASYRGGHDERAIEDLRTASDHIARDVAFNAYLETGRFAPLAYYETAQIYLAMAYDRRGDAKAAAEALRRAHLAEKLEPSYRGLDLGSDAPVFLALARRLDSPFVRLSAHEEMQRLLRRAEALVEEGRLDDASKIYAQLARNPQLGRVERVAVATGSYRIGDFARAAQLLEKLTIGRGEEDLYYYRAVSLFEIGRYADAHRDLQRALPHIEITDEVARTREKIAQMARR